MENTDVRILVLGRDKCYYAADTSEARIRRMISEFYGLTPTAKTVRPGEDSLYSLRIEDERIPGDALRSFGTNVTLRDATAGRESLIDCMERCFRSAAAYAARHNADNVLVQDLKVNSGRACSVDLLAQLLI